MINRKPSPEDFQAFQHDLSTDGKLSLNFMVLALSACIIATLGLLTNSAAVIIGAMIVAPLMIPLRSLAFGVLISDTAMVIESLTTLGIGSLSSIVLAWMIGRIFALPASTFGSEILARTAPNLADLGIAIAAGAISGFAKIRPQISDAVAGTAISVALMPPLCVVGITFSQGQWEQGANAFLLYFTNLLGITFACLLVFVWGGYYFDTRKMQRALRVSTTMLSLLVIPLFFSLWVLLRQKNLESTIKDILQTQTITVGQKAQLVAMQVNRTPFPWEKTPARIILNLRTLETITPVQVSALERFLEHRLGQHFEVVIFASQFQEIRGE